MIYPVNMAVWATGPVPAQYWSDAGRIGLVLAHYGMFMGVPCKHAGMAQ